MRNSIRGFFLSTPFIMVYCGCANHKIEAIEALLVGILIAICCQVYCNLNKEK